MIIVICLELVCWKPSRRHSANREPTQFVIGITNYDRCEQKYWLITEIDNPMPLEELLSKIMPWIPKPLLIFKTRKGYHIYWNFASDNPTKIFHYGMKELVKLGLADKHHLKLARARAGELDGSLKWKLILRISPKYASPDIKPVYVAKRLPLWHSEVLLLAGLVNANPGVRDMLLDRCIRVMEELPYLACF